MKHAISSTARRLPAAVRRLALAATLVAVASAPAVAGTIGFRTDAKVKAGPGIDVEVTLTHTGDEAASDVSVQAELDSSIVPGEKIPNIGPGQSKVWNFHVSDQVSPGIYSIVLRVRYADANGYPFEIVSTAQATAGVTAKPRMFGSVDVPGLTVGGESNARIVVKRPPERSGKFRARLVAPAGLAVTPGSLDLEFDENGKAVANFKVRNLKLLAGTSVNVFAFVTGEDAGFPQVDSIRGTVQINATPVRIRSAFFYRIATGIFALLVVLELAAWMTGRRRHA